MIYFPWYTDEKYNLFENALIRKTKNSIIEFLPNVQTSKLCLHLRYIRHGLHSTFALVSLTSIFNWGFKSFPCSIGGIFSEHSENNSM